MIVCSKRPLPLRVPAIGLNKVRCTCGAVGNWQQAKTTEEEFASSVRGLALKAETDGVQGAKIVEHLRRTADEIEKKEGTS